MRIHRYQSAPGAVREKDRAKYSHHLTSTDSDIFIISRHQGRKQTGHVMLCCAKVSVEAKPGKPSKEERFAA